MDDNNPKRGRVIKTVAAVSMAVLMTLIFFSKTVYNFNLPQVTAVAPFYGKLNKVEKTTGLAAYYGSAELYAEVTGKINAILVREGDEVIKGQHVFEMSFEGAEDDINKQIKALDIDLKKKLDDLRILREKLNIDIDRMNLNISNTERKIDELKQEIYISDDVSDYEIIQCANDIKELEADLKDLQALYDAGAIPSSDVENAERNIQILLDKYDHLQKQRSDILEQNAETTIDKETYRIRQLNDYEHQLDSYSKDIALKKLDLSAYSIQESACKREYEAMLSDYTEKLSKYKKNKVIYAPKDAIISKIHVNSGQNVNAFQQLATFGLTSRYVIECEITLNNNFVMVGDTVNLSNSSHTIKGTVTKIVPAEHSKAVTISIDEDGVTAGETFEILFEKQSSQSYTLVPNGAVNRDSTGYYVRQIARRNGILGKEYYTKSLKIYIGDSDSDNTVVLHGIDFFEPVTLISDKPFSDGETIKLMNESDFIEN